LKFLTRLIFDFLRLIFRGKHDIVLENLALPTPTQTSLRMACGSSLSPLIGPAGNGGVDNVHRQPQSYYELVRPCATLRYYQPRNFLACAFLLTSLRQVPAVPRQSQDQAHATSMPGAAWPVSRYPPDSSWEDVKSPVLTPSKTFDN